MHATTPHNLQRLRPLENLIPSIERGQRGAVAAGPKLSALLIDHRSKCKARNDHLVSVARSQSYLSAWYQIVANQNNADEENINVLPSGGGVKDEGGGEGAAQITRSSGS